MLQYALIELLYVIAFFGSVAIMAYAWKKYQDRKSYKTDIVRLIHFRNDWFDRIDRQKLRDDHIFNTVEEWRNELA